MKFKFLSITFILMFCVLGATGVFASENEPSTRLYAIDTILKSVREGLNNSFTQKPPLLLPDDEQADKILEGYSDVYNIEPAEKSVLAFAVEKGIITGYPDGTIRPCATLTRGEYAVMINRVQSGEYAIYKQIYVSDPMTYYDVEPWCSDAVRYCMQTGLMSGYGDSFGTNDPLTVLQVDTIAQRYINGLSPVEAYRMNIMSKCNGLDYYAVMESVWTDEFLATPEDIHEKAYGELCTAFDKNEHKNVSYMTEDSCVSILNEISEYEEYANCFDYEQFHSEEAKNNAVSKLVDMYYTLSATRAVWENRSAELNERWSGLYNERYEHKLKTECFFVSSPQNVYAQHYPTISTEKYAKGYEYVIYYEGSPEDLPEGVEFGKWYRRKGVFEISVHGGTTKIKSFSGEFSEYELVPEYMLK